MKLNGQSLIGASALQGTGDAFQAVDPARNEALTPTYHSVSAAEVDRACDLARSALADYRASDRESRARFLEAIAGQIDALGDELIERAMAESGLPRPRLEGERGRTTNQLKLFAQVVRSGRSLDVHLDSAQPDRQPPRPDLRSRTVALGPVAVFGASNFPLAFSVAGGDTASALAAGCPVIVKAHPAHPGTSELVGLALQRAVRECQMPEGVFSLLFDAGHEVGAQLVAHPVIQAVGFTGSRRGGTALMAIARSRPVPIPVYAEMSSINPLFLLDDALAERAEALAKEYVGSLQMGAGQFCTNPGLLIAQQSEPLERFVDTAVQALTEAGTQTMLTPGIAEAYDANLEQQAAQPNVELLARGGEPTEANQCRGALLKTDARTFLANEALQEEVFGAAGLLVVCQSRDEMLAVARALEGQLTAGLHLSEQTDTQLARALVETLELKAGRLLINGFPTGVEVCGAMVHGGPYPATSDSRTTSVGTRAIERFLRPVCYQNFPESLLPRELRDSAVWEYPRVEDNQLIAR